MPGPDPESLEALDYVPEGVQPIALRVTYTSNSVDDYVNLKKSEAGQAVLELADPLFGIVRMAGRVKELKKELAAALGAVGLSDIIAQFKSAVADYVNQILGVAAFPESITLGLAAYLLKKAYEADRLLLGYIHHASIDELPNWMGLIENAEDNPDLSVH